MVEIGAALFAASLGALALGGVVAPALAHRLRHDALHAALGDVRPEESRTGRVDILSVRREDLRGARALAPGMLRAAKRAFDVIAASALLVFLAPLLAATAIAIKIDSPGPVLYRQRRIGLKRQAFDIFKFRSMRKDAEKDGARWAAANDDRITRVGRFIRRTRIDEIPQCLNILRGEMSFVGPRPERPEFVTLLETEIPNYHARHLVKPGITGWAQVRYVYTASVEGARDKLAYDLFYIKHFSLFLDMLIVIMTVRVALLGIGSR